MIVSNIYNSFCIDLHRKVGKNLLSLVCCQVGRESVTLAGVCSRDGGAGGKNTKIRKELLGYKIMHRKGFEPLRT